MGKKFIMIGSEKHYIEEEKNEGQEAAAETAEQKAAQAKEVVDGIIQQVTAGLDLDAKMAKLNKVQVDEKMLQILNGKDISDKNSLTKEEKIVGFYHALVMKDVVACKALAEGVAADGGYLFPDEFRAEIVKSLVGPFTMRSLVRVVPMKKDVMVMPGVGSRPKVYWTAENEAKTTTTADFTNPTLTAKKCAAILYASDELIEDSTDIDVVQLVIDLFADAIKDEEDKVICQGNGTTQPTGLLTAMAASAFPSRVCSGNLDLDDIINLIYDLPQAYRPGAVFLVAKENLVQLQMLKDSQGRYLWRDADAGLPATIKGYPVYEQDYIGNGTIVFGNLKLGYWVGDRKQMTVKLSQDTETAFTKDQTAIRVVERIAGNVVLGDAIRALKTIP